MCPYCQKVTQPADIYCSHCGKALKPAEKVPWYLKKTSFVVAFLIVGPFALPLLWINPKYSLKTKIIWSVLILVSTWALGKVISWLLNYIAQQYNLPV